MKAAILSQSFVKTVTFEVTADDGQKYIYISHQNEKGKEIDCEIRDSDGNSVDDPALAEEISEAVDLVA